MTVLEEEEEHNDPRCDEISKCLHQIGWGHNLQKLARLHLPPPLGLSWAALYLSGQRVMPLILENQVSSFITTIIHNDKYDCHLGIGF